MIEAPRRVVSQSTVADYSNKDVDMKSAKITALLRNFLVLAVVYNVFLLEFMWFPALLVLTLDVSAT